MQRHATLIAIILLVSIVGLSVLSLKLLSPPQVVPSSEGDQTFSAERALIFLSVIAKEPHPPGTVAHAQVRDYIYTYCQRMGLETQLTDQTGLDVFPGYIRAARAQNIIARLKGTHPGKAILVMSHYDSQPNTPGASDDGAGVAAAMEVIRMLRESKPLANDVIFLFSDQEETGLLGAEAFVSQYKNLNEIGLIMCFESRGNAGVSFTFEFSKENGWLVREYKKAIRNPFANSFAYEIYKVMPNDTDFSRFRKTGISGYNSAFIEGYAYYHSMADRIENMDVGCMQNHGDILWRSLLHFGNLSLENTKGDDMIFFNPVGSVLWLYPLSLDVPLMILAFVLWITWVILGIRKERIRMTPLFAGLGLFTGFLALSGLLVWGLGKSLTVVYPYYTNFYSYNFYNIEDYFVAVTGLIALAYVLLFQRVSSRGTLESVLAGSVFLLLVFMICIKLFLNTGAYLIYYPVIILELVYLFLFVRNIRRESQPSLYSLAQLFILVPYLLLWIPIAYYTFITFSLILPFGPVLILSFAVPFLLPTLGAVHSLGKPVVWLLPIGLIIGGLVIAHVHSGYDRRHPLQTQLMYALDADQQKAFWISGQKKLDSWTQSYFPTGNKGKLDEFYPGRDFMFWKAEAPVQQINKGKIKVMKDSVTTGKRYLTINVLQDSLVNGIRLYFPEGVVPVTLNERKIDAPKTSSGLLRLSYVAPPAEGITVKLIGDAGKPMEILVVEQRMGLPSAALAMPLPQDFIFGPDYISNTTQVKYTVKI